MLTGIKDKEGRAGYFDETIRDMVVKGIAMKAAWQVRLLSGAGKPVAALCARCPAPYAGLENGPNPSRHGKPGLRQR